MNNTWGITEQDAAINNGLQLAKKLGKATSDTEVAYKFLKEIDAKKLRRAEIDVFLTKAVNVTTFYYDHCNN